MEQKQITELEQEIDKLVLESSEFMFEEGTRKMVIDNWHLQRVHLVLTQCKELIRAKSTNPSVQDEIEAEDWDYIIEKVRGSASDCHVRLEYDQCKYIAQAAINALDKVRGKND